MTREELQDKWWYRLVKVIFIFSVLLASAGTALFLYYDLPQKVISEETSVIMCNDNDGFIGIEENDLDLSYDGELYLATDQKKVKRWCAGTVSESGVITPSTTDPSNTNYEVLLSYELDKSWWKFSKTAISTVFVIYVFFWVISRSFFYIVAKEKFF